MIKKIWNKLTKGTITFKEDTFMLLQGYLGIFVFAYLVYIEVIKLYGF